MSALSIDEKCGCGAEFHWRSGDNHPNAAKGAAAAWREEHRHAEPAAVGICGDANQIEGPSPSTLICDLPAGHAGWHRDGDRGRWGYPRWTACDGRPCRFCAPTTTAAHPGGDTTDAKEAL